MNGESYEREVDSRRLLIHFLRDDLDLTGSHIGCDTGNCGACSVILDGTLVKSCMLLAVQADGANDRDGRGSRRRRRADAAAAGVQRPSRAPVRLLHAGDADERDGAPRARIRRRARTRSGRASRATSAAARATGTSSTRSAPPPVRRWPGMSETIAPEDALVVEETGVPQRGWAGQSVPRKEDKRLVQGEGLFVDDIKRHGMGYAHFVRSPYAHANITSIDVSKAEAIGGVYGTLIGEEVAALTDPFFQIASPPGAHVKDYALAVGKVRHVGEPVAIVVAETRELARDASELVEVEYEPLRALVDARQALDAGCAGAARGGGGQPLLERRLRVGRPRRRVRGGGPDRQDQRAPLRPLQLDAARVRRRTRRVQPRHGPVDDLHEQPVPRLRRDHDGPRDAERAGQAPVCHAGHRRRLRQQDHLPPSARRHCLARAQAEPPDPVD